MSLLDMWRFTRFSFRTIYLNDLFFFLKETDVYNFANDTNPFVSDNNLKDVVQKLEHNSATTVNSFEPSVAFHIETSHFICTVN